MSKETKAPIDEANEFIARLRAGDQLAYRELYRRYRGRIYRLAAGITLDSTESHDIVQEVFLKAYRNIQNFKGESGIYTWLHRIAVNESLNWKRKWKRRFRRRHVSLDKSLENGGGPMELTDTQTTPEVFMNRKSASLALQRGLQSLPEEARTVFVLKELEGLTYEEIAQTVNIKKGTVSSRLHYARKRLQEILAEEWQEGGRHET